MYGHPKLVKKMAKAFKPAPTFAQFEQAKKMRLAKQKKATFIAAQIPLFQS